MLRLLKAPLACVLLVSCLAIGFGAGPVSAGTTMELVAHPWFNNQGYFTDFSLLYNDTGDGLFTVNELIPGTFSGVGILAGSFPWWPELVRVPYALPTYEVNEYGETVFWITGSPYDNWEFGSLGADNLICSTMIWRYTTSPVPIPPSVFLLGAGLMGLAAARRKKRLGP